MTDGRDDDALSWGGDEDPTLDVGASASVEPEPAPEPAALPAGYTAVGKDADTVGRIEPDGTVSLPQEKAPMNNVALVSVGILGGVYLLYMIGWVIGGLRLQGTAQYLVSPLSYLVALWLAVLAAPLWFAVTYLLTRRSKSWVRLVWLVTGAVLLVPWPFIMTGAVGQ